MVRPNLAVAPVPFGHWTVRDRAAQRRSPWTLDILAHPNQAKCPGQRVLVVACDNYAYLVPFVEEEEHFFLNTGIPSRKATRSYLNQGDTDAENGLLRT